MVGVVALLGFVAYSLKTRSEMPPAYADGIYYGYKDEWVAPHDTQPGEHIQSRRPYVFYQPSLLEMQYDAYLNQYQVDQAKKKEYALGVPTTGIWVEPKDINNQMHVDEY